MLTAVGELSVQIIVPARNEEACIGRCLQSLVQQQGISFEVTVVDDGSTDKTRAIAESFMGVRVLCAPEPSPGVTGKCNALIFGAKDATATWLLFTDADTFHYPGSLARAVAEAEQRGVDLLSYSPEQETGSWAQRALMPVIFADLARTYPPRRVNDPADPAVAANGQYILVKRLAYQGLGGHKATADKILEDVELARLFKVSHHPIWFRQGTGLVRTRMYRSFSAMVAGWTKNLALLFPRPLLLAAQRGLEFLSITILTLMGVASLFTLEAALWMSLVCLGAAALLGLVFWRRIRQAHFSGLCNLMAFFGLPIFAWLLLRSWRHICRRGAITWKGRSYTHSEPRPATASSIARSSEARN